jgi:uncharacterized protein YggT (Ycf19 family)
VDVGEQITLLFEQVSQRYGAPIKACTVPFGGLAISADLVLRLLAWVSERMIGS